MGPALYVLAILGCGEGEAACEPVLVTDVRYESREACLADTAATLGAFAGLDYPVIVAQCRVDDPQPAALRGADVRLPEPDPRPSAWDR